MSSEIRLHNLLTGSQKLYSSKSSDAAATSESGWITGLRAVLGDSECSRGANVILLGLIGLNDGLFLRRAYLESSERHAVTKRRSRRYADYCWPVMTGLSGRDSWVAVTRAVTRAVAGVTPATVCLPFPALCFSGALVGA